MSFLELRGMGEGVNETPALRPVPWEIGKERAPTASERRAEKWERASLYLGVLGAFTGLILALPELRRMLERRKQRGRK